MDDYTDSYAIRILLTMRSEALWFLDDAYGVMLSQYGYQESYDSASQ